MKMQSLGLCLLLLASQTALAEDLTFKVTNGSNTVLTEFYASPTGVNNWEEDILGVDVLNPGESADITIADGRGTCTYDLLSAFSDGDKVEEAGVNLCDTGSYTIHE